MVCKIKKYTKRDIKTFFSGDNTCMLERSCLASSSLNTQSSVSRFVVWMPPAF